MSSKNNDDEVCRFGHVFETTYGSPYEKDIRNGKISTLEDVREEAGSLKALMGEAWKSIKVKAGSTGTPYGFVIESQDKFDEDLNYNVEKVSEKIFVSPESPLFDRLMQQRQQAEQRVKQTSSNLSDLTEQKHMLEHDVRKLRSRVEDLQEGDEIRIKSDFIELVDGAGSAGGQGGDQASLKFLRDQNIYPSIVADFQEMESLDDLKSEDEGGTGKLSNLPSNVKAILKKKYAMYEKWKDLYGSEVQRKLRELKAELQSVERAIKETEKYLEPYVRDMEIINQKSVDDMQGDINRNIQLRGYSSLFRELEFMCYRPLVNDGEDVIATDDESEATHYRVVYIFTVHANLAGGEDPTDPNRGPTVAKVFWYPAIVDKILFENVFKKKIEENQNQFKNKLQEYKGEFKSEDGDKLSNARIDNDMSVADLRNAISEEIGERVPLELSSKIRRVEDGMNEIEQVLEPEIIEAIDEILGTSFSKEDMSVNEEMYTGIERKLKEFTGKVDQYYIPRNSSPMSDFEQELKFGYYYDLKITFGLHTMK